MLTDDLELRPMGESDTESVVALIAAVDEDDAEEAAESYAQWGLENQFVLTQSGRLIGVIGYRSATGTDRACWLSWTYIHPKNKGHGLGTQMLRELLDRLRAADMRKVFVSTSDYKDPQSGPVYAAAHRMYENCGFTRELLHPDYYAKWENQIIYGLALQPNANQRRVEAEDECLLFNGMHEVDETEGVYAIQWAVKPKRLFGRNTQFTQEDLQIGINQAREWNARAVFIALPSNIPSVLPPLAAAGFIEEGRLIDYFEDGIDEIHFRYDL